MENSKICDYCLNFEYDEQLGFDVCSMDMMMDMDDKEKFLFSDFGQCPFFRVNNEYKIVEKQN